MVSCPISRPHPKYNESVMNKSLNEMITEIEFSFAWDKKREMNQMIF